MIIAITGGLGCGKSTAVKIFGELGFRTLDSDDLVREIYSTDPNVKNAIREHFGQQAVANNDEVDKVFLSKKIFSNAEDLTWLENLLHPKVKVLRDKYIAQGPLDSWAVEIPLLFEKNLENEFDFTICLSARNDLQLSRLSQKGFSLADAQSRIASQLSLEEKEKRADYVIYNNENIETLRTQICALVRTLKEH